MKRCLFAAALLSSLLLACGDKKAEKDPATPQEMYERAQALLKPDVGRKSSDFRGSLQWLHRAAEGGYVPAMTDLGGLYLAGGKGVQADAAEAYRWFTKAAEQGNMAAHVFLGQLLFDGQGVARDEQAAREHWKRAAESGIAEAQYRLGRVLAQHTETAAQGVEWLEKAAREVPAAHTALGHIFYTGANGVPRDIKQSADCYAKGAAAGDPMAQLVYAEMLFLGDLVPKDEARGLAMLRMAAGQDYPRAVARLIQYLRNCPDADRHAAEADAWDKRLQRINH